MPKTDTEVPTVVDTPSPDVVIDTGAEVKEVVGEIIDNPDVVVDAGEVIDKTVNDVPEAGNWYDNLEPDYKNDPNVTKYKSLSEFAKGNRELSKMIGKDKLIVPTDKSTEEEVNEFYNKLGRPEEASKYTVPEIDIPDSLVTEDGGKEAFMNKAHELGLSDKQFSELYKMNAEMTNTRFQQEVTKAEQMGKVTETELRKEFGAAYESKIDGAQKVINKFFQGKEMHPAFAALSNDQGFVKAMSEVAESLGEDVIAGTSRSTKTPSEAQGEWNSIVAGSHDMSEAYFDDTNPEHTTTVDYVLGLQSQIGGV